MSDKQNIFDFKIKFDLKTLIILILFVIGLYFLVPKLISLILFAIVTGGALYLFYLYRNKSKFRFLWSKFIKFNEEETEIFEDIYRGIGLFGGKKRYSVLAIIAGLVYWLGDIACFFPAVWAFPAL